MKPPARRLGMVTTLLLGLLLLALAGARFTGLLPPLSTLWGPAGIISPDTGDYKTYPLADTPDYPPATSGGRVSGPGTGLAGETNNTDPVHKISGGGNSLYGTGDTGSAGIPNSNQPLLQQQIEARYIARLQKIAGGYEGRLYGLVGQAWNEYITAKKQGQNISVISLARKYMAAGTALEKQCDAEFYATLDEFRTELLKNSLPLDTVIQAQREYERVKAARKRHILTAAAKLL